MFPLLLLLCCSASDGSVTEDPGSSTVLYRQEAVKGLHDRVQVHYTTEALARDAGLRNGFIDPELNQQYDKYNLGRTHFAMFGQPANPAPATLSVPLEHLTGLLSGEGGSQLGIDGGPEKGINALQAYGAALGVSLAPRAITPDPFIHGVFAVYNWAEPVRAFPNRPEDRIRVEGYFRHPFTAVKPVGEGLIAQEGTVFFYYTLQFRDTTRDRDLWFVVRLYQDKFARASDPWTTLMDREALAVDGKDPETSIGLIDTFLRPDSTRITPCAGSSQFSLLPFEGERYFAFELSAGQFQKALRDLNAAKVAHAVFSENPRDYTLKHYNINVESWAPTRECNPRLALSWRDIKITAVRAPAL